MVDATLTPVPGRSGPLFHRGPSWPDGPEGATVDEPVWLLGFFTGRRHAVLDRRPDLIFRGVPLAWSVCGVPVVVDTPGARGPYCAACIRHAATTWTLTGAAPA